MARREPRPLADHALEMLTGGSAHLMFDDVVAGWPAELQGTVPEGLAHSGWQLLEHMRIAQLDILDFTRDPNHESPAWPQDYWPSQPTPPTVIAWQESVTAFQRDLQAMCDLVRDPDADFLTPFPHGDGQTLLRQALLTADHNAYHLAQMVDIRKALGIWPPAAS